MVDHLMSYSNEWDLASCRSKCVGIVTISEKISVMSV